VGQQTLPANFHITSLLIRKLRSKLSTTPTTHDAELEAMQELWAFFETAPEEARHRMAQWIVTRYACAEVVPVGSVPPWMTLIGPLDTTHADGSQWNENVYRLDDAYEPKAKN
jgi:hypothetical protein